MSIEFSVVQVLTLVEKTQDVHCSVFGPIGTEEETREID